MLGAHARCRPIEPKRIAAASSSPQVWTLVISRRSSQPQVVDGGMELPAIDRVDLVVGAITCRMPSAAAAKLTEQAARAPDGRAYPAALCELIATAMKAVMSRA